MRKLCQIPIELGLVLAESGNGMKSLRFSAHVIQSSGSHQK